VAQKVSVTFACDYDAREIPAGEQLTRTFSLDDRNYEIDLCEKHSQKFDEALRREGTEGSYGQHYPRAQDEAQDSCAPSAQC